jgi:hypothetical protein
MKTAAGSVGAGLMVPEMVKFWSGKSVKLGSGLENVIESTLVVLAVGVVALVVVDCGSCAVVLVGEIGGVVTEVYTAKMAKVTPTSSTATSNRNLRAIDRCDTPIACSSIPLLIIKLLATPSGLIEALRDC